MENTTTSRTYKCYNAFNPDPEGIIVFKGDTLELIEHLDGGEMLLEIINGYQEGMQFELEAFTASKHFENISN